MTAHRKVCAKEKEALQRFREQPSYSEYVVE